MYLFSFLRKKKRTPFPHLKLRRIHFISFIIFLLFTAFIYIVFFKPSSIFAAPWAQTASLWNYRKQLTLVNNTSQTLEANTTYSVSIDTKSLVASGQMLPNCNDIRVFYQPSATETTRLSHYTDTPNSTIDCSQSSATKIYFSLQANISNNATDNNYYIYYGNRQASNVSTVDAFDIGAKSALLACPFSNKTTCINGSGAQNPTTETGAIRYSGGKSALNFDGVNDEVSGPDLGNIRAGDYTAEAWFKTSRECGLSDTYWMDIITDTTKAVMDLSCASGVRQLWFWEELSPTSMDYRVDVDVSLNTWHHVAFIFFSSSKSARIFLDGNEVVDSTPVNGSGTSPTTFPYKVGYRNNAAFNGQIDEVRISNIARYSSNFTPQVAPFVRDANTKLLLHFDENGDDPRNTGKAIDDSGNGNDGTITGAKYVGGLVGVDGSSGSPLMGKEDSQSYAGHDGVFVEEGTTNKITNPSFENSTYDTNWTASGGTATENTTAPYYKFGSKSYKLVLANSTDQNVYISINAGNTNTHTLSAYVYDGTSGNIGGTVDATVAKIYWQGAAQTTTYTDMGGGWWRLSYSAAGTNSAQNYGVTVLENSGTLYIDGIQLEEKVYATTYVDGTLGTGYSWSGTANNSTSSRTRSDLQYPISNVPSAVGTLSMWVNMKNIGWTTFPNSNADSWELDSTFINGNWYDLKIGAVNTDGNTRSIVAAKAANGNCSTSYTPGSGSDWRLITFTWSASGGSLYENGILKNSTNEDCSKASWQTTNFFVGGEADGIMDSVMLSNMYLYSDVLTSTEVADLYYSGLGSHSNIAPVSTEKFTDGEPPILAWHLDEGYGTTAYDSTILQNNGTISGATWSEDGPKGAAKTKSLKFDGTNDYISKTYSSDYELDPGTGQFSLSTWFKHPSTISGTDTLISRYSGAGYKLYMNSSGYICFGVDDDSTWGPDDSACTTTSYADSTWHHVQAVKGASTIAVYIDGVQKASTSFTVSGSLSGSSTTFYSGIDSDGSSNPWDGFIDEIRIYNTAKSEIQIKQEVIARGSIKGVGAQFGSGGAQDTITNGLVGYWKMDEASWNGTAGEVIDASGNGNNGVRVGDAAVSAGKFGNGGTFDGSGDYLNMGSPTSLDNLTANQMTAAFWVKRSGNNGNLISKDNGATEGWTINHNNGQVYVSVMQTSPSGYPFTQTANDVLELGVYHYVVVTYNNLTDRKFHIFIDGKEATYDSQEPVTGTFGNDASMDFMIGWHGYGSYFDGDIDDARIYNRALSPAEVAALYNWAPGPFAYYKFDEGASTNVVDSSGNNYTGTWYETPHSAAGKYGKAAKFVGESTNAIRLATIPKPSNMPITFSFWTKPNTTSLSGLYDTAPSEGYVLRLFDAGIEWWVNTVIPVTVTPNEWVHISITYSHDGTNRNITWYKNGIFQSTNIREDVSNFAWSSWFQLGNVNSGEAPYSGLIDEFKIYNYARTPAQIIEDMNGGHPIGGSPVGSQAGYWKFDEGSLNTCSGGTNDFCDTSMNTNDLVFSATAGGITLSGKYGKAFDGNAARYVSRADDDDFDFAAAEDFTLSAWIKTDGTASGTQYILNKSSATAQGYGIYGSSSGKVVFAIDDDTTWSPDDQAQSTTNVFDQAWHYIAARKTGTSKIDLFVDGRLEGSDISLGAAGSLSNAVALYIGDRDGTDNGDEFNGDVDEVKIYRGALTDEQIKLDYNQGQSTVMGAKSTASDGITADNSSSRAFCVPGDTSTCSAPVAWWKMDEGSGTTISDSSGNGYISNAFANNTAWTRGKSGKGLAFDGTNDSVSIADNDAFSVTTTNQLTVEAWVKTNAIGAAQYFVGKGSGGSTYEWNLQIAASGVAGGGLTQTTGSGYLFGFSTSTLSANTWYHLAFTADTTSPYVKLYVNGILVDTDTTTTGSIANSTSVVRIGEMADGSNDVNGAVDDVRIYNYARTPAQVAWDYNHGGPAAWYRFDECQGTTAYDSSPNNNYSAAGMNGTITIGATGTNTSAGTCTGAATEAWKNGVNGKIKSSISLDGTDDYVSIADSTNSVFDFASGQTITISAWIKPTSLPSNGNYSTVVAKYGTSQNGYYAQIYSGGNLEFCLINTGGTFGCYTSTQSPVTVGTWQHIVYTMTIGDSTSIKLYYNGKLLTGNWTMNGNTVLDLDNGTVYIGATNSGGEFFIGQMDDVRIYRYALTDIQIKTVMNNNSAVNFAPITGSP